MKTSRLISLTIVILIIIVICGATSYKIYSNHRADLLKVTTKKIEEAALKCNLEGSCEDKMTFSKLKEKGYIDNEIHPITKEFINDNLEITCSNYECKTKID